MKTQAKKLLKKHDSLIHSENMKVTSHVQRQEKGSDWIINTIMLEGYDVPFKYKRNKQYRNLQGARINLTYYPATEAVAGIDMEVMKVVRIKIS